jgi:hypothetical protein
MRSSVSAACIASALLCAAQGCGRLGYGLSHDSSGVGVLDSGVTASDAASQPSDSSVDSDGHVKDPKAPEDAGMADRDGAVLPFDGGSHGHDAGKDAGSELGDGSVAPSDAALPHGDAQVILLDATTPLVDAGHDAGTPGDSGTSGFDCKSFPLALVCTDFSALPASFTINERDGHVTVSGSLSVRTTGDDGEAAIATTFAPVKSGMLFARFKLRVPHTSRITALNLLALTESLDQLPPDELNVNLIDSNRFDFFVLATNGRVTSDSNVFKRDVFQCVDLSLRVDQTHGSVRILVDGQPVINSSSIDTQLDRGIARVTLGIDYMGTGQAATALEIDDFVLSQTALPPCQ